MKTAAIVPAAGRGERLGPGLPKALRALGGAPLLAHAVHALDNNTYLWIIYYVIGNNTCYVCHTIRFPLNTVWRIQQIVVFNN